MKRNTHVKVQEQVPNCPMLSPEAQAQLDKGLMVGVFEGGWAPDREINDMSPDERAAAAAEFKTAVEDGRCRLRVFLPDGRTGTMGGDWQFTPDAPEA